MTLKLEDNWKLPYKQEDKLGSKMIAMVLRNQVCDEKLTSSITHKKLTPHLKAFSVVRNKLRSNLYIKKLS